LILDSNGEIYPFDWNIEFNYDVNKIWKDERGILSNYNSVFDNFDKFFFYTMKYFFRRSLLIFFKCITTLYYFFNLFSYTVLAFIIGIIKPKLFGLDKNMILVFIKKYKNDNR